MWKVEYPLLICLQSLSWHFRGGTSNNWMSLTAISFSCFMAFPVVTHWLSVATSAYHREGTQSHSIQDPKLKSEKVGRLHPISNPSTLIIRTNGTVANVLNLKLPFWGWGKRWTLQPPSWSNVTFFRCFVFAWYLTAGGWSFLYFYRRCFPQVVASFAFWRTIWLHIK